METFWYIALAWLLATYVVLDGFDLGAGILHLWVAQSDAERRQVLRSLGPVWDGNEVWILAAGGTMFFAFPRLLASAFSGFYLPLMLVLWLFVFRALGIELRAQLRDRMWTQLWDVAFAGSSLVLVVCFGAALGNVLRGVTFVDTGLFFAPLWTHLTLADPRGVIDWFTLLVAMEAVLALAMHGALWLAWRTDAAVQQRARRFAQRSAWLVLGVALVNGLAAFLVQPGLGQSLARRPWGALFPLVGLLVLAIPSLLRRGQDGAAFLCSALHLYGMLGACAVGLYPSLLPSSRDAGLTIQNSAASPVALETAVYWWLPGMLLVLMSHAFVYSRMSRTFSVHDLDAH